MAGLEQKLNRGAHGRRSERVINAHKEPEPQMSRSRSLEMLDTGGKSHLQGTRYVVTIKKNTPHLKKNPV